jgi:ribosome-binding factor A
MEPHRAQRVSEALREELAEIVEYELSDPRLAAVTVTGVHVTPDLRKAHVLFLAGGAPDQGRQAREALEHAAGYLRGELSRRLSMWRVPELYFSEDAPSGAASRVEELLARVRKNRKKEPENSEK